MTLFGERTGMGLFLFFISFFFLTTGRREKEVMSDSVFISFFFCVWEILCFLFFFGSGDKLGPNVPRKIRKFCFCWFPTLFWTDKTTGTFYFPFYFLWEILSRKCTEPEQRIYTFGKLGEGGRGRLALQKQQFHYCSSTTIPFVGKWGMSVNGKLLLFSSSFHLRPFVS